MCVCVCREREREREREMGFIMKNYMKLKKWTRHSMSVLEILAHNMVQINLYIYCEIFVHNMHKM